MSQEQQQGFKLSLPQECGLFIALLAIIALSIGYLCWGKGRQDKENGVLRLAAEESALLDDLQFIQHELSVVETSLKAASGDWGSSSLTAPSLLCLRLSRVASRIGSEQNRLMRMTELTSRIAQHSPGDAQRRTAAIQACKSLLGEYAAREAECWSKVEKLLQSKAGLPKP